jgi:hypothetical protein
LVSAIAAAISAPAIMTAQGVLRVIFIASLPLVCVLMQIWECPTLRPVQLLIG